MHPRARVLNVEKRTAKKNKKIFKKPIDKPCKVCYNVVTGQEQPTKQEKRLVQ